MAVVTAFFYAIIVACTIQLVRRIKINKANKTQKIDDIIE